MSALFRVRPRWWAFTMDNSLLLVAGTITALIWANVDLHSYERLTHGPLHFLVNDVGMVFFFALAAKEIFEARLAARHRAEA